MSILLEDFMNDLEDLINEEGEVSWPDKIDVDLQQDEEVFMLWQLASNAVGEEMEAYDETGMVSYNPNDPIIPCPMLDASEKLTTPEQRGSLVLLAMNDMRRLGRPIPEEWIYEHIYLTNKLH